MEIHQGRKGFFGDPCPARPHLGLGDGGEPGVVVLLDQRRDGRLLGPTVRALPVHVPEDDLPFGFQFRKVGEQLLGQSLEGAPAELAGEVTLGEVQVLGVELAGLLEQPAAGDVAQVPETISNNREQEQQLARPQRHVERNEPAAPGHRLRLEGGQALRV